ncbi:CopY/TcrY family copper transport repressor [Apilactobacillus ozensis]|uniref:CopY/TcrY family copper transport repressor n=1 Tax=Apilactobacillus ozensis TaxID=866801 RepID=UPI00200A6B03|nr:CopY/TcrY family copper transport repressor [Apilactobacillus ozensis]MCK8607054.1 CopY/TcrY family copper transport repressor [Apilactobacillus ozensis]
MQNDITLNITSAEWEVMRIVWTLKKTDSKKIIEVLSSKKGWSASTIKTLIGRLLTKNALKSDKQKRKNIYFANIDEQDASELMAVNAINNVCCMQQGTVIKYLINNLEIKKSDIRDLIEILKRKEKDAKTEINCNCLSCPKEEKL